jgi:thiamine-monophosphate kinase
MDQDSVARAKTQQAGTVDREREIIERIGRKLPKHNRAHEATRLVLGMGDDAAILRPPRGAVYVVSCDAFLENVHFLADSHPAASVGYKALARATSDLAAMGATPRFFLLSLALPAKRTGAWLDQFLSGLAKAARSLRMVLAGGDTAENSQVTVNLTVIGEAEPGRAITRSGARPGDAIYVSGTLGQAQLGLELFMRKLHRNSRWQKLLKAHLYPQPRLTLGKWLARRRLASAMIDLSDGLSTDLTRLCKASSVGARLRLEQIPAATVPAGLRRLRLDPLRLALDGGEDYELLFTVHPRREKELHAAAASLRGGMKLTRIGEITRKKQIILVGSDGRPTSLRPGGWVHFRPRMRWR